MVLRMFSGTDLVVGVVVGGAVAGIGISCYCHLEEFIARRNGTIYVNVANDQWYKCVCRRINTSFMYLGGSMCLTFGAAALGSYSGYFVVETNPDLYLAATLVWLGSYLFCIVTPYEQHILSKKRIAWAIHCAAKGLGLAALASANGSGVPLLAMAGLATAVTVGGYAAHAFNLPNIVSPTSTSYLTIGLGVVILSSLGAHVISPGDPLREIFKTISSVGGLALFSIFVLYDSQELIARVKATPIAAPFDPIDQ